MKTTEVSLLRMCGCGIRADDKSDVCRNRVTEDLLTRLLLRQRCDWRLGIRGPVCTGVASLITVLSPLRGWRLFLSVFRAFSVATCLRIIRCPGRGGGGIRAFFGPTDMKSHQHRNEDFINLHGCPVSAEQFVFRDICTVSVPQFYTTFCPMLAIPEGP